MARKQATPNPAPPVEQKLVDPEPSAPVVEEAAQPLPVVELPPAPPAEPEPAPAPEPTLAPVEVEPLAVYAARIEEAAQPLPVCQVTHPEAKDGGLHVGKYAGIRLVRGEKPAALLSDGRTM